MADQLEQMGAPQEIIEQARERQAEEARFVVLPENAPAVHLFCLGSTQWRTSEGRMIGLDYGALEAACRMSGLVPGRDAFAGVRAMEAEALAALSEKRS